MQLQQDSNDGLQINAYALGKVQIAGQEYTHSVIVTPERVINAWPPQTFAELKADDFKMIVQESPELILLGTGETLIFPEQEILADVYAAKIGIEIMDTAAACRTFNLLVADGRNVLAALIL